MRLQGSSCPGALFGGKAQSGYVPVGAHLGVALAWCAGILAVSVAVSAFAFRLAHRLTPVRPGCTA